MRKYEIIVYDLLWAKRFEKEATILTKILSNDAIYIIHIGNTFVPGMADKSQIEAELKSHLLKSANIKSVTINLVWEPAWNPSNMASDEIKDMLGLW